MKTWIRSLALMSALAVTAGSTISVAAQQDKKAAAKDDKKETKKGSGIGSIEIRKNDKGKWRYLIKNADGKTVAMPLPQLSWNTKEDVLKALEEIKETLNKATPSEAK